MIEAYTDLYISQNKILYVISFNFYEPLQTDSLALPEI